MSAGLERTLGEALGEAVRDLRPVSGGDVNQAYRAQLASGRDVFVKTHPQAQAGVFTREAEGLAWLSEGGAAVPEVLSVSDTEPCYLALAWVRSARRAPDFDPQLGTMLARLHASGAPSFGADEDNFIGPLPQPNAPCADWASFYAERRLLPFAERAHARGSLDRRGRTDIERVAARLPDLVGEPEAPARLHGDLWSGNVMSDARGGPLLIDPAVYGGHREVDLAMLSLFGRVSPKLRAAYEAVWPLSPDHEERVSLYQLYPLLVHAVLFGGGYGTRAAAVAREYV